MRIGDVGFNPFVYNTNYINAQSMNRIAPIDNDVVTSGTDYTSLVDDLLNENPLQKGETANFADVLAMQFSMAKMNASRLIKPAEGIEQMTAWDLRREQNEGMQEGKNLFAMQRAAEAYGV